jgi:hypothetical protein
MYQEQAAAERFPRTYRVDERTRQTVNFLIVAIGGLFLSLTLLQSISVVPHRGSLGGLYLGDFFMAGLVLLIGSLYNKRVVLHQDSIEVAGWFRSRKLYFAQIRGCHMITSSRGSAYIFFPADRNARKLILPTSLHIDDVFRDWLKTIPQIKR